MLPLRPPVGKPAPLVCTYAATGHNSAVLSLDVTEDLMITGSKGWFASYFSNFFFFVPSPLPRKAWKTPIVLDQWTVIAINCFGMQWVGMTVQRK